MKSVRVVSRPLEAWVAIRSNRTVLPFREKGLVWTDKPMSDLRIATMAANLGFGKQQ